MLAYASFLFSLLAAVHSSIIPLLDSPPPILPEKFCCEQLEERTASRCTPMRIISLNTLFDRYDRYLDPENRWPNRYPRIVEYLEYARPDILAAQELRPHQREDLQRELGEEFASCGCSEQIIFYNKKRFELMDCRTMDCTTRALFRDREESDCLFTLFNTHLCFGSVEKRQLQVRRLRKWIEESEGVIIAAGDFNSFPHRPDLCLPFYDGEYVMREMESSGLYDARVNTISGHYGIISTTNYSTEKGSSFCCDGEPGVILDHIFVSKDVKVITHGIDPAKVDGQFTSDHFPVIADLCLSAE